MFLHLCVFHYLCFLNIVIMAAESKKKTKTALGSKKKSNKKNRAWVKTLLLCILSITLIATVVGIDQVYRMFYKNVCTKSQDVEYLYVNCRMNVDELISFMKDKYAIESEWNFKLHAELLHFTHVMPGRYLVNPVESDLDFIRRLRNGEQTPVKISFNNIRTKAQLAQRLSEQLMTDSTTIHNLLNNQEFLQEYDLTPETALTLFLPNTYEVYWSTSAKSLIKRLHKEYTAFWNEDRRAKAQRIGLTPTEVSILASIVEEETTNTTEKPIVAGLYLNRLRIGMPLQADPTVKYAVGDFTLRRILNKHLLIDSPYNTYKYGGLPPGPIRIPSIGGLEAVLNSTKHKYLYMCAKETFNGEHNFATNLAEHNRNAQRYQAALNKRKIMK